jgi:hypothetical protein
VPIHFKYLFNRADNNLFSPYAIIGYNIRCLLLANLNITQDGNRIKNENIDLKFKNPLLWNKLNASMRAGFGWQKNSVTNSKGNFFVELNFIYGFSPYYFQTDYSASSLFMNSKHVSLHLGLKF